LTSLDILDYSRIRLFIQDGTGTLRISFAPS
jgi:hypothetical protein